MNNSIRRHFDINAYNFINPSGNCSGDLDAIVSQYIEGVRHIILRYIAVEVY